MKTIRAVLQKGGVLLLTLALLLSLSGCMDSVELKNRSIIKVVGVDWAEDEFLLTMLQFSPQAQSGEQSSASKSVVAQTSGKSISEAMGKLGEYNGNEVFLGNISFLVVGKEAAEQGLERTLTFFNADHEVSPEVYISMAQDKAEDIVRAKTQEGANPQQLKSLVEQGRKNGLLGRPTLRDVMNRLQSDCADPYLPIFETVKLKDGEDVLRIAQMAVFKNGRLQDTLSIEEAKGVLWATNELNKAVLTVDFGEQKASRAAVELTKSKSRVKVKIENDHPVFYLNIRAEGNIREVSFDRGGGTRIEELGEIQNEVAAQIKSTVQRTLDKVFYEDKSDVFRYSEFVKKYEPQYWKANQQNWDELIGESEFHINVECSIDHPGLETKHSQTNPQGQAVVGQ